MTEMRTGPESEEDAMPATFPTRTYERFEIRWDRGSVWTGFESLAEAVARCERSEDGADIVRVRWEHQFTSEVLLGIARPGIAERQAAEGDVAPETSEIIGRVPAGYTTEQAIADGYDDLAEAAGDAAVNGWGAAVAR